MQGSANLNIMIKAARKAGRSLTKDFREVENLLVSRKGAGDFVTRADLAAEKIIRDELLEARPTYGFLGEETGEIEGQDPTRRWIVDPLDGTTNFLHGLPHWAVSIALEHKGQIVAGVIYDPSKDELFFAEKGAGAWMNESRIRVAPRSRVADSLYATGIPFGTSRGLPETLLDLAELMPACAGVRRCGALSLDIAYVAAGRYDGCWERSVKPWDIAAGIVIAKEAGAIVEGVHPNTNPLESNDILLAGEEQFEQFSKFFRR
jgi:myo-inositol-1(or 4)-monophosphatase